MEYTEKLMHDASGITHLNQGSLPLSLKQMQSATSQRNRNSSVVKGIHDINKLSSITTAQVSQSSLAMHRGSLKQTHSSMITSPKRPAKIEGLLAMKERITQILESTTQLDIPLNQDLARTIDLPPIRQ